jgi:multiple sugar transport system permease protein
MKNIDRRNLKIGLLFISPWIIGFSAFVLYPFIATAWYSLCSYNIFKPPKLVGLLNFVYLLNDRVFWISLYNTFYYAFFAIPAGFIVSLGLALLLNSRIKGLSVYRVIFYLPSLIPIVALSILWLWIFNGEYGILNHFLSIIGVEKPPNWLTSPNYAKLAFVLMSLWTLGPSIIIYLAALQDVPKALTEAAEIDGARWYHKIRHIIIPVISPSILFNVVTGLIYAFQIMAAPYMMTRGGPGKSTTFYMLYLYQKSFEDFRMGYASAMALILFIIILGLTLLVFKISSKKVFYME